MAISIPYSENMVISLPVDNRKEERTGMPSFVYNVVNNNNKKYGKLHEAIQKTLRADKNACNLPISLKKNIKNTPFQRYQKRVSLSGFSNSKCSASMTVEASLVFSLFLVALINLLSVIEFMRLQSNMNVTLYQIGKKMAIYGYAYEKSGLQLEEYPLSSVAFSYSYVKSSVESMLGKEYLDNTVLKNGKAGIFYGNSKIMENDRIDLVALYKVSGLLLPQGLLEMPIYSRFYGHVWNGYDVENQERIEEEEVFVFITKNGTVYHRSRNCTHLNPAVEAIHFKDVGERRNESGAIYYACELCGNRESAAVYITKQGNRYHSSLECGGLKRTIFSIPLSEVDGRPPCSKCGG